MSANTLRGSIPDSISGLTKMSYLNLDGNYLVGTIPSSIAGCTALQYVPWLRWHDCDIPSLCQIVRH